MIRTDGELLEAIRQGLRPGGTAPVVRIQTIHPYFNQTFIESCLSNFESIIMEGRSLTDMEKLALYVLMDSAYIERQHVDPAMQDTKPKGMTIQDVMGQL